MWQFLHLFINQLCNWTQWQNIIFTGADANLQDKNGNTPLHLCAKSGYVECCRKLTPSGVNVNCVNFEKRTCLHLSAFKGSVECLDFLIASGANINVVDKHKRLPLHYAASRSWFDCTFTLVCSGNNSWIKFFEYRKVASSIPVYYSRTLWPKFTVHKHQISPS